MGAAQERAKALAAEIRAAVKQIKATEARVKRLGEELTQVLAQAKAEAEAARYRVVYPTGRYACKSCGRDTLFTEPTTELPSCDNCGGREWSGHEPQVTEVQPPLVKRYGAGMYQCASCGIRIAVPVDTDELVPCDLCGATEHKPLA